jgi:twitching motility two-component system response regulator PilH
VSLFGKLKGLFGGGASTAPTPAANVPADWSDEDAPPLAGAQAERRLRERRQARAGLRILVIDDSATIVALLRRMLRQNGYDTSEAGDAEQGLASALADPPDLIFLDIVLPGMNGFAALRALRRDHATRHIPIIMISGNEQATEEFYLYRIGADDFMKKPFSRAEVFARIERLLDEEGVPRRIGTVAMNERAEAQAAGPAA